MDLRARTILLTLAGSRVYGLHTDDSDVDVKGVAVPPAAVYHGLLETFEHSDDDAEIAAFVADLTTEEREIAARTKLEGVVYEVRKFLRLASDANPNILDALFCRDADVRLCTPLGERLRAARDLFVTARCKHTFAGYASAQLQRIQLHWRWHHQGPERPPTRADHGLPETTLIPRDQLAAAEAAVRKQVEAWNTDWDQVPEPLRIDLQARIARSLAEIGVGGDESLWRAGGRHIGLDENFIELMSRERAYAAAHGEWTRYLDWKRRRNPARAAMEARFGYDVKHGAHLVRLLRMGREILETGRVNVWRGGIDAEELRAIRAGAWSYERLLAFAQDEGAALDRVYEAGAFAIPRAPDRAAIDRLCQDVVEAALTPGGFRI